MANIKNENGSFSVRLIDDGTLDTVLEVFLIRENTYKDLDLARQIRFETEYANQYRDESGALTDEGFATLADEAIELYLDMIASEDMDTASEK